MREQRPSSAPPVPTTASALARAVAMLGLAAAAHRAAAQTEQVYVDSSAPAGGNGTSWQQAFNSLTAACNAINVRTIDHDLEVRIAQGTYRAATNSYTAFTLNPTVTNSAITLSVLGAFAGLRGVIPDANDFTATPTVITGDVNGDDGPNWTNRADNAGTVLRIGLNTAGHRFGARLYGLRVKGGASVRFSSSGGGLDLSGVQGRSGVLIDTCEIAENDAESGGGVLISQMLAPAMIRSTTIRGNRAISVGGGLFCYANTMSVSDCVISDNVAANGGGVYLGLSSSAMPVRLEFTRCVIAANSASSNGGGVYDTVLYSGTVFTSCLFAANSTLGNGGGILSGGCQLRFSTLVGNRAAVGGGLCVTDYQIMVTGSIFDSNTATVHGDQVAVNLGYPFFERSLIRGGPSGIWRGIYYIHDHGIIDANPRFVSPAGLDGNPATWRDNDYRLLPGSPCIDGGVTSLFDSSELGLDLERRLVNATQTGPVAAPDLGCYEFQHRNCPADTDGDQGVTIDDLLIFLDQLQLGDLRADFAGMPVTDFPDGGVTIDDLLFYLARYDAGC
jgi:predicted outer membrane repeat protein